MAKINVDQLADEIAKGLKEYSQNIVEMVNAKSEKIGKEAVKRLQSVRFKQNTGYSKSWAMKTEPEVGQPNKRIIHVKKPFYRLTHLLEYGHAKRGGGRVEAIPHIRPVEEQVIEEFTKEVEEAIKSGEAL